MSGKYDAIRLDKSRAFGVVFPPENNAHYAQDGFHFDANGNLAEEWLKPADRAKLDSLIARRAADAAAEKARIESLKNAGLDDKEIAVITQSRTTSEKPTDADGVDLKGWARGEINIPWFKVRKAFMEKYSRDVDNQAAAIDFLIDEGVITAETARTNKGN